MRAAPDLDFAIGRGARQQWRRGVWAALGLLLGLQCGLAAWRWQTLDVQRAALQAQQQQLSDRRARNLQAGPTEAQTRLALAAQGMLDSLSVPWEEMLQAIEAAAGSRVLIESIVPRAQDGSVRISISAPQFPAVAGFVKALGQQGAMQDVMLVSETLADNGPPSVRAVISANWRKTP